MLKCVGRGIDNVAIQGRWPLTTGVAQGRYYCTSILGNYTKVLMSILFVYTIMIFRGLSTSVMGSQKKFGWGRVGG